MNKYDKKPSVYLAAPYAARDYVNMVVAPCFEEAGCQITSTWHKETHPLTKDALGPAPVLPEDVVNAAARACLEEVAESDFFVMMTKPFLPAHYVSTGGMHVELGVALAEDCFPILIGEPTNIFHRLHVVRQVNSIPEATGLIVAINDSLTEYQS